jgi:biotin transport system substrate-specific component
MAHLTATSAPANTTRLDSRVRTAFAVVAGSLFVALCAHISVPLFFTPVPITMQPFAVLVLGLLLDPTAAFGALALYLIEGAAGMPVFTPQGPGGLLQLFGPTGGYLLSYPFVAAATAFLYGHLRKRNFATAAASAAAGNILILTAGTLWLATVTHQSFIHALSLSVAPFLPGDALKVCAAAAVAAGWLRLRKIEETAGR